MDFASTKEQLQWSKQIVSFAPQELTEDRLGRDERSQFPKNARDECAKVDIHGLPISEQHGGTGADIPTIVAPIEGLGHGCKDYWLVSAMNAPMWSVQLPILICGTEKQKRQSLPKLFNDEIKGPHGMSEPSTRLDVYAPRARAKKKDVYVLKWTKTLVIKFPKVDLAAVFSTIDPLRGLVDRGLDSISFLKFDHLNVMILLSAAFLTRL